MFATLTNIYAFAPAWITLPYFLIGIITIWTFLGPVLYQSYVLKEQDFKQKYNAKWALVTGGSSGIGEQIARRLAKQGINVVIAALDNNLLHETVADLKAKYPDLQFRAVGVDLSSKDFMDKLIDATKDVEINLLFNNAGYITTGFFAHTALEKTIANYNVNSTCTIKITHHYLNLMLQRKQKGLIEFTSSSGGFIPGAMTGIYSATKAFITNFGASLAAETYEHEIDILVVNPSPIASNFFANAGGMAVLQLVKKTAQPPIVIADTIFRCAGRTTVVDQGLYSVIIRIFLKILDWNVFADIMATSVSTTGDYKNLQKKVLEAQQKTQ
ncbi:hypothetical protein HK097_011454 [Rhizophlyctis rosea]|uniref:Uncharacterized protein n=1 Tax=Rhizophlyctis rosea TaxID=64517 RepID=A0AAD5S6A8_9FUNG|nr:hypothetical protein HK097_011454 [Rhizophlyctis rosea]